MEGLVPTGWRRREPSGGEMNGSEASGDVSSKRMYWGLDHPFISLLPGCHEGRGSVPLCTLHHDAWFHHRLKTVEQTATG